MRGASMVEYVVLVVLIVGLVGGALLGISDAVYNTLKHVNADIGR
jgi:Flp pilus assembly pilin Flp